MWPSKPSSFSFEPASASRLPAWWFPSAPKQTPHLLDWPFIGFSSYTKGWPGWCFCTRRHLSLGCHSLRLLHLKKVLDLSDSFAACICIALEGVPSSWSSRRRTVPHAGLSIETNFQVAWCSVSVNPAIDRVANQCSRGSICFITTAGSTWNQSTLVH